MYMLVGVQRKYRARDGGSQEGEASTTAHLSVVCFFLLRFALSSLRAESCTVQKKALSNRKGRGVR